MQFGISDKGIRRLKSLSKEANEEIADFIDIKDYPNINAIYQADQKGIAWRVQPAGAELENNTSMDFSTEGFLDEDSVWAFPGAHSLFSENDWIDEIGLKLYYDQVLGDGSQPELIQIAYTSVEEGPASFIIVYNGEIVQRFKIEPILEEIKLIEQLLESLEEEYDYDFRLEDVIELFDDTYY